MNSAGLAGQTPDVQLQGVPGEDDAAGHGAQHSDKHQRGQDGLENPKGRIAPPAKAFCPLEVQPVVEDKEREHPKPHPLVGRLA